MEYLNTFNYIICESISADVKIKQEDKSLILLLLLQPSFKHLIIIFLYRKETIKIGDVARSLLSNEFKEMLSSEE